MKGLSEYTKEFRDPKRRHRRPDLEPFAGFNTPNLVMTEEPYLQKKKKVDDFPASKLDLEPQIQQKKRSERSSPIPQMMEPQLQRKKKPLPYKGTTPIATEFSSAGHQYDDYMLLGDQSKFNDNVKYHVRSRSAHGHSPNRRPKSALEHASHHHHASSHHRRSSGSHGNHHHHHSEEAERPSDVTNHDERKIRSRDRGPPPKVLVDTGKPRKTQKTHEGPKDRPTALQFQNDRRAFERLDEDHRKGILRKSAATQSTPRLTTNGASQSNVAHENPQKLAEKEKVSSSVMISSEATKRPIDHHTIKNDRKKVLDDQNIRKEERSQNSSSKERGPNHAMKYRIGIAPHLSNGPVRFSEYQREYRWRDSTKASPLINAETVIYKSHPDLTLFKSSGMADDSEYRSQFRAWKPSSRQNEGHYDEGQGLAEQPKKFKMRRSKSLKEFPTQPKPSVSTVATTDSGVKVHSEEEGQGHQKHEGQPRKKYWSEYSSNFMAPSNYHYEEGAWKKIRAKAQVDVEAGRRRGDQEPSAVEWYSEVLELRRFADDYRKRAQGTHFSREHLAQLYAKNAELWDTASSGSVLSSRPVEDEGRSEALTSSKKSTLTKTSSKPGRKPFMENPVDEFNTSSGSMTPGGSISSPVEDKENSFPVQNKKRSTLEVERSAQSRGRQPENAEYSSDNEYEDSLDTIVHRVLSNGHSETSKPVIVNEKSKRINKLTKPLHERTPKQSKTSQTEERSRGHSKTTIMSHGLPTKDSHVLVDANSQSDHRESWAHENPPQLTFEDKAIQIEDDLMSVASFHSLASSSSLASEVLERAKNRRTDFWK